MVEQAGANDFYAALRKQQRPQQVYFSTDLISLQEISVFYTKLIFIMNYYGTMYREMSSFWF